MQVASSSERFFVWGFVLNTWSVIFVSLLCKCGGWGEAASSARVMCLVSRGLLGRPLRPTWKRTCRKVGSEDVRTSDGFISRRWPSVGPSLPPRPAPPLPSHINAQIMHSCCYEVSWVSFTCCQKLPGKSDGLFRSDGWLRCKFEGEFFIRTCFFFSSLDMYRHHQLCTLLKLVCNYRTVCVKFFFCVRALRHWELERAGSELTAITWFTWCTMTGHLDVFY